MLWILDSNSGPLGPDMLDDECGDEETNEDSNAITDLVEICVWRVSLFAARHN